MAKLLISCSIVLVASVSLAAEPSSVDQQWPRFRGPLGTGQSEATKLPKQLSVHWSSELPVRGHSSPVVWDDRVFLTGTTGNDSAVQRRIVCVDRNSGKVLWNHIVSTGGGESLHKMNSWATPSCLTDGERVVAFFGNGGLHCYSVQGERIWSRDLGDFAGAWGVGASPVFYKGIVIQNCDAAGDSYLLAVDAKTGKDVWRTPRRAKPKGGWSTPIIIDTGERTELVLNGEFGVTAYDPSSGQELWNCQSFNGRGTPVPVWGDGLLYCVNGKSGDVYAVKPGGKGDVTDTRMVWHTERRGGRDLPSPVLANNVMVVIGMSGVASGYDAKTGKELWKQRLGGNFSGSPVVAGGLVFAASEEGVVNIFKPGNKAEIIAQTNVADGKEEVFRSSLAVHRGQLLLRSDRRLYCLGN